MKKNIFLPLFMALVMALVPLSLFAEEYDWDGEGAFEGDINSTGAVGKNGAAASANVIASQIAVDILEKGGNAVDAAVAMIYAVGLLEPAASGIGGAGQMVIDLADTTEYDQLEYMT